MLWHIHMARWMCACVCRDVLQISKNDEYEYVGVICELLCMHVCVSSGSAHQPSTTPALHPPLSGSFTWIMHMTSLVRRSPSLITPLIPAVAAVTKIRHDCEVQYGPSGLFLDKPHPELPWMRIQRSYGPVGHLSTDIIMMLELDGKC